METKKHLELTVNDLVPFYRDKPPDKPRFFHFLTKAVDFHEADVILFKQPGKPDVIIKDRYGVLTKAQT